MGRKARRVQSGSWRHKQASRIAFVDGDSKKSNPFCHWEQGFVTFDKVQCYVQWEWRVRNVE